MCTFLHFQLFPKFPVFHQEDSLIGAENTIRTAKTLVPQRGNRNLLVSRSGVAKVHPVE